MRPTMVQNLRAILQRAGFSKDEIDALHGVIGAFERLPAKPGGESSGG
jgi:tRNA C32,U32 (ribose-2'-O)-methylase TrmJ